MKTFARRFAALAFTGATFVACIGTTGGGLVTFRAFASGPADLPPDVATQGLTFVNGQTWSVTLRRARVHVGALYLNRSVPVSGGQERSCFLPGVYVAQVLGGADIDALSGARQPFPAEGNGTADPAVTGEVWLTGGRIDALDDRTIIADVEGSASRGGLTMRFEGTITIGRNRATVQTDPARPGSNPLCAERIVTPIPVAITPTNGGTLLLRVDPRAWFSNVDFAELEPVTPTSDLRRFPDENAGQPAINLYTGLRAAGSAYRFEWIP